MELKVNYYKDIEKIDESEKGGWYQLRCAENEYLNNGEVKYIPLGMSIELPDNYEVHVHASKLLHKCRLGLVEPVIFDKFYDFKTMNREWSLYVACFNEHGAILHKDDVIAEFRIMEHHNVTFKEGE